MECNSPVWVEDLLGWMIYRTEYNLFIEKEKALGHQETGMYFWVTCITCPFKLITGQQGGENLCSMVITKSLISIIFSLWHKFQIDIIRLSQSTSKYALSITFEVTVNSFNWIHVRPTGWVLFGQKSESIWIDQIHLGCLPRNLPSLILPTLWLYCLPEERNYCSASTDGNGKDHIVWWKVGEVRIKKRVRICASSKSAAPDLERWVTSWFEEIVKIEAIVESKLTPGCVCCQVVGSSDFEPGLPRSTWVRGGEMH